MAENIKHFPVNWIDGMKINKNHFIELQDNIEDLIRDARNLEVNELNYGLLPTLLSRPFNYTISIDTHNELSVTIKMLKAITPAGGRIEITDLTGEFSEKIELKDLNNKETNYFLLLNVDPYSRVPSGEQNTLTCVAETEVNQNNIGALQFPIAKFKSNGDSYEVMTSYIPPSLTLNSHPSLVNLFETYDLFFKQLEFYSIQINRKIKFRTNNEDENMIANMVFDVCDKALRFVELQITRNKWTNYNLKPIELLDNIVSLSRSLKNSFDYFSGDGKEMLFNYFSEWTDISSGDYERLFTDTINVKYNAYDIEPVVLQIRDFASKMDQLFSVLNQLDYIGKKRDAGIFVNENILKNDRKSSSIFGNDNEDRDTPPSSPTFLAD
jgi:hypothetical protein